MILSDAIAIVQQFYSKAVDPALTDILDLTKGMSSDGVTPYYRPYIAAAMFIAAEYARIEKADVVTFKVDPVTVENTIRNLMAIQRMRDGLDPTVTIPDGVTVDEVLPGLLEQCVKCETLPQTIGFIINTD